MKRLVIIFNIFLLCIKVEGQTDTIVVHGSKFMTVTKIVTNEYMRKDTLINLYRIENGHSTYLLRHYIYKYSADCNNEFITHGIYKIQNDSLIFLTAYDQKTGIDPIPVARKQIFRVETGGKLISIYDKQQERSSDIWIQTNYKDE